MPTNPKKRRRLIVVESSCSKEMEDFVHAIKTSNAEGLLRHVLNQQRRKDALEKHGRMVYDSDKDVEGEFSDE